MILLKQYREIKPQKLQDNTNLSTLSRMLGHISTDSGETIMKKPELYRNFALSTANGHKPRQSNTKTEKVRDLKVTSHPLSDETVDMKKTR